MTTNDDKDEFRSGEVGRGGDGMGIEVEFRAEGKGGSAFRFRPKGRSPSATTRDGFARCHQQPHTTYHHRTACGEVPSRSLKRHVATLNPVGAAPFRVVLGTLRRTRAPLISALTDRQGATSDRVDGTTYAYALCLQLSISR